MSSERHKDCKYKSAYLQSYQTIGEFPLQSSGGGAEEERRAQNLAGQCEPSCKIWM